ncbi:MAG: hypothetical protein FWC05_02250 [Treponema sp.]|nr:hypothetical protein [Treponema sp.]
MKNKLGLILGIVLFFGVFVPCYSQSTSSAAQTYFNQLQSKNNVHNQQIDYMQIIIIIVGICILLSIISAIASNKSWTYNYKNNTIVVKNTVSTCELLIDGQLHDKKTSALSTQMTLQSKLESGEEVSVHVGGGWFGIDCNMRIGGKIIRHINK